MAELVGRKHYFRELAPWIQETINLFKGKNDVEFHVVAPNYASNTEVNITKDNLHYHFYHYSPTLFSRLIEPVIRRTYKHAEPYKLAERLGNVLSAYNTPTKNATRIVKTINPDIIHLFGSENPDYSKAANRLLAVFPVLLTVQGFAYLMEDSGNPFERVFHWYMRRYEAKINRIARFITTPYPMTLKEFAIPEKHFFEKCERLFLLTSITKVPQINACQMEKKYDVVFYARIVKDKGIEDLIEAIWRLKQNGRVISAVIMGRGNETYVNDIKSLIKEKGIQGQFNFVGFVENHEDVYKIASTAKLLVLPTYQDGINNTVREAMFMRLPIVAYGVTGLDAVNNNRDCVHLVTPHNIDGLAEGICKVLDDDNYRNELISTSYKEAVEVYSPEAVYGQMLGAYKDMLMYLQKQS